MPGGGVQDRRSVGRAVPTDRARRQPWIRARWSLLLPAVVLVLATTQLSSTAGAVTPPASAPSHPVATSHSAFPVVNQCQTTHPAMPTSTGTQTPSGFPIEMTGVTLASAANVPTLQSAYYQFNDMLCSKYSHQYQESPPDYYYYDCVGFTGYTVEQADPTAWRSVVDTVGFRPGQGTATPTEFATFFQGLPTTPEPGWQADPTVQSIQPGDILAWQPALPDGAPDLTGVGHSVIPLVAPQAIAGSDNSRWEVVVMDATQDPHGPDDTRQPTIDGQPNLLSERNVPIENSEGTGVSPSGLGIGTMVLDTPAGGGPVTGIQWAVGAGITVESVYFGAGHPDGSSGPVPIPSPATPTTPAGYSLVGADGGVFSFGDAPFWGSLGGTPQSSPAVGMAASIDGNGYWEATADGGVFTFGNAAFRGSMGGQHLNAPIVGMASDPDGSGYWLAGSDGGVFAFGSAAFRGSMGGQHLNAPIVGIAATPDGGGYWEVASDGGVFAFGDAAFYGSMGGRRLNAPIVGIAATPDGAGYWEVASDGGVFAFGDAAFYGSMGGQHLNAPVVSMVGAPGGAGYWLVAADGGVFSLGSAMFVGSLGGRHLNASIVGSVAN